MIVSCLILSSCGAGFRNFQAQKFTDLKAFRTNQKAPEPIYVELIEESPKVDQTEKILDLEDENPKVVLIKDAITEGKTIIIHQGEKRFKMKNPVYDSFKNELYGDFEEVDQDAIFPISVIFEASKNVILKDQESIGIGELTERKVEKIQIEDPIIEKEKVEYYRPTNKLRKTWPEVTKEEQKEAKNAVKAKRYLGLSLIGMLGTATGFLSLFATGLVWPIVLIGVFTAFYILMFILVRINIIKYRKQCDRKKKRMRLGMRIIAFFWGRELFMP